MKAVGASVGDCPGRGGKQGLPDGSYFLGEVGVKDSGGKRGGGAGGGFKFSDDGDKVPSVPPNSIL